MSSATVLSAWAATSPAAHQLHGLYDQAIRAGGGSLNIAVVDDPTQLATPLNVSAFITAATTEEHELLALTRGSVLDVGCGPGRIVRAALDAQRPALGIDISQTAVSYARARGLDVLNRSVFDPVPEEGTWGAIVLLDGNIGIGGNPDLLLRRCVALRGPDGHIVIEVHQEQERDVRFQARLIDAAGAHSATFPWAEAGATVARRILAHLGLATRSVSIGQRHFVLAS